MRRLLALLASGAILLGPSLAQACPGCIESVKVAGGHPNEVLAGFSLSVLFMLGSVLAVVGGLTSLVVKAAREVEEARARALIPIPVDGRKPDAER